MNDPNAFWAELHGQAKSESTEYVAPILYYLAKYMDAKVTAEIGSMVGFVSVTLAHAMKENGGKHYVIEISPKNLKDTKDNCVKYDVADPKNIEFVLGDSAKIDFNEKLDLLFIDGDHNTEPVVRDIKKYWPLINKGGLMCFHDVIFPSTVGDALNSPKIKTERDQAEIINLLPFQETGIAIWKKKN